MTADGDSAVVVLIGPPAAGKSTVGRLLATELGVPFADTDALVARAAGKPVGDIFVEDGDAVFREFERGAVASGIDGFGLGGGVLALGSGGVLDPDVRRMIGRHRVVYLEAGFGAVAKRTGFDKPRVVIPGNPRGRLRTMLEERRPVYESLAALTVPTDDLTPQEVAADLARQLSPGGATPRTPRGTPDGRAKISDVPLSPGGATPRTPRCMPDEDARISGMPPEEA